MIPRGIRNNNPGNLERNGVKWQGLSKRQMDSRFFQFDTPVMGIRAMMKVLLTYQRRHNLNTVRQIIYRWAPPHENNTLAYVTKVADALQVKPDAKIKVATHLVELATAIIQHENGKQPYPPNMLEEAYMLALDGHL